MSETAVVPAEWFAIMQRDTLPGAAGTVVSAGGTAFVPMSGKYLWRGADGSLTAAEDGFLTVGDDGHPVWHAEQPA